MAEAKKLVVQFSDGSRLFYQTGSMDNWQVAYGFSNDRLRAPLDRDYLGELKKLAQLREYSGAHGVDFGLRSVLNDFQRVYDIVLRSAIAKKGNPIYEDDDIRLIFNLVYWRFFDFRNDRKELLSAEKVFFTLYLAMISEWHYVMSNTKRSMYRQLLKDIAVHQVLIGDYSVTAAANWSKKRSRLQIEEECEKYGINYNAVASVQIDPKLEQRSLK